MPPCNRRARMTRFPSRALPRPQRKANSSHPNADRFLFSENAPANLPYTKPLPPTSALKPVALTSPRPSVLKQALLRSPSPSVRAFGPLPTSAARPPRAAIVKDGTQCTSSTPGNASARVERNGGAGERRESGAAFAQLRGQLQLLLQSGEHRQPKAHTDGKAKLLHAQGVETKRDEIELTTPLNVRNKGATPFLSPALLWTPSQGPSPSLASIRERLAGMAQH